MALPTTTAAPRHRSALERVAEALGGEAQLRQFLAVFAEALEHDGPTLIETEARGGRVTKVPMIYAGKRAWL